MDRSGQNGAPVLPKDAEPVPCWKELLQSSFEGMTWGDNALEALLDRLEKSR